MKQLFIAMLMLVCIGCCKEEDPDYAGTYTYTMNYERSHEEDGVEIIDYTQENVTVEVTIQDDNLGGQVISIRYDGLTDDKVTSGSFMLTTKLGGGAFYTYNTDGSRSVLGVNFYDGDKDYEGSFNLKSHRAMLDIRRSAVGTTLYFITENYWN